MAVEALVTDETYLRTSYEPECEFENGVLIERNVGEEHHSWLQTALAAYFFRKRKLWNIEVYTEQRCQLRAGQYRVSDVCVIIGPRPSEPVFSKPPLIWIEVLSPDDRPIRVNRKIREVLEFGVPNVWVIDPDTLEAEIHTQSGTMAVKDGILRVEGMPIEVPLSRLGEE